VRGGAVGRLAATIADVIRRPGGAAIVAVALLLATPASGLAHGEAAPSPELPGLLLAWRFNPLPLAAIVLAALAYVGAVRSVNEAHPASRVPPARPAAFLAGLAAIGIALLSPIDVYAESLLWVHMVQHLLLQAVAGPLLLLGAPITLALRAARPSLRRPMVRVLRSWPVHAVSFPVVAWLLFAGVNWGWHLSPLYNAALESPALHHLEHVVFLAAALLFWFPVVGLDPGRWRLPHPVRLLYLGLAMPQNSFLGVAIMSAGSVLYRHYATLDRRWGPSPLADQQLGGTLMWVVGDLAFLVGGAAVIAAWMRHEERRAARLDARLDAAERAAARLDADERRA
jgi:putative membrane protein